MTVDLPNLRMVIFHSYVNVYQRVAAGCIFVAALFSPINLGFTKIYDQTHIFSNQLKHQVVFQS